jgi:cation transporter-like permease
MAATRCSRRRRTSSASNWGSSTRSAFRRPITRPVYETLVSTVGGLIFLLVAYLLATRGLLVAPGDSSGSDLGVRLVAPLIFGACGVLMTLAATIGARRLLQRRVLEVPFDEVLA